jgi:hypothetical protein
MKLLVLSLVKGAGGSQARAAAQRSFAMSLEMITALAFMSADGKRGS